MTLTLRRLLSLAGASRRRTVASAMLAALTILFGVGLMATAGYLISRAAERPAILSLTVAIVGVRFFGLGRPVARYLDRLAAHDLALRALTGVRARVYRRLEPLAPAQLVGHRDGDLLARLVADVDSLQDVYLRGVVPALAALAAGCVSVGVAAALLPAAGLFLAAGLVAGGVLVPMLSAALTGWAAKRRSWVRGELTAELVEALGAAPELAAFGGEAAALGRVRSADRRLLGLARRDALAGGAADAIGVAVTGATVAGVLAVGAAAVASGRLDRVLEAMLGLLALAAFEAVTPLAPAARDLGRSLAAGRRVLELTDLRPALVDPPMPVPRPTAPVTVALEGVRARYAPGEPPAFDGVDLRLGPGRRVALVGASGSGKSTVANLLLRFLDPEAGRVTLDGVDLRLYRQEDVRRMITVAGQESQVFSASIRDNVALGRAGASDDDIWEALARARIAGWVRSLPAGWDTPVGEAGRELSGGQRQRLTLARALLADAHVLVLDEPTAHLDPLTARALMTDLLSAAGQRSVLLITHRPEGLDLVDDVVVHA